jgi:hypothetical protein
LREGIGVKDDRGGRDRHRFLVQLEGIELDESKVEAINRAVQRAVLSEVAELDFRGDVAARIGDGSTQGIQVIALTPEQSDQVGLVGPWATE